MQYSAELTTFTLEDRIPIPPQKELNITMITAKRMKNKVQNASIVVREALNIFNMSYPLEFLPRAHKSKSQDTSILSNSFHSFLISLLNIVKFDLLAWRTNLIVLFTRLPHVS